VKLNVPPPTELLLTLSGAHFELFLELESQIELKHDRSTNSLIRRHRQAKPEGSG
jgi:hypothetical protein